MENLDIHAEETDLERARRLLSEPANHQEGIYLANALLDELKRRREQPEDGQAEFLKRLKQLQDIGLLEDFVSLLVLCLSSEQKAGLARRKL